MEVVYTSGKATIQMNLPLTTTRAIPPPPSSFALSDSREYCKVIFMTSARYTRLKKIYMYIRSYFMVGLHVPCLYTPLNISNVHSFCQEILSFLLSLLYKIYRRFAKRSNYSNALSRSSARNIASAIFFINENREKEKKKIGMNWRKGENNSGIERRRELKRNYFH